MALERIETIMSRGSIRSYRLDDIPDVKVICLTPRPFSKPRYGMVGSHYTHELQHIPPRAGIDVELGVQALHEAAERMLPVVESSRAYVKWLDNNPRRFIPS